MVCEGPEPPEISSQELSPQPITPRAVDSDDEDHGHAGYQPLSQGDNPDNMSVVSDGESDVSFTMLFFISSMKMACLLPK